MQKLFSFFSSWKVLDVNTDWIGTGLIQIYTNCLGSYSSPQWECGPLSPLYHLTWKPIHIQYGEEKVSHINVKNICQIEGETDAEGELSYYKNVYLGFLGKLEDLSESPTFESPRGRRRITVSYCILQGSENWKLPYADLPTLIPNCLGVCLCKCAQWPIRALH